VPSVDNAFGGFVWADLANDTESVPFYKGEVFLKALRLPSEADLPQAFETLPGGTLFANKMQIPASATPSHSPSPTASPLRSPGDSPSTSFRNVQTSVAGLTLSSNLATSTSPRVQPSPKPAAVAKPMDDLFPGESKPADVTMPAGIDFRKPVAPPGPVLNRSELVAKRIAGENQRVAEAAARQAEIQRQEDQLKKDKVECNNKLGEELDRWAKSTQGQGHKDIKVLLSTMHTVLWPDSSWQELPLSQLVVGGDSALKKWYRKAILVVHPDKQKEASPEQQVRADRIFQALNEAWKIAEEAAK